LTGGLAAELAQHVGQSDNRAIGSMVENPR